MIESLHILAPGDMEQFLDRRPYSLVHLDAEWDGYRAIITSKIEALAGDLADSTSFGYIDIDRDQDHARAINLRNVPACSYYRGRDLVATVIGLQQDIKGNLAIIRQGGIPDTSNIISRH